MKWRLETYWFSYIVLKYKGKIELIFGRSSSLNMVKFSKLRVLVWVWFKGPSQPHLYFCLHARIWLLYFIRHVTMVKFINKLRIKHFTIKISKFHILCFYGCCNCDLHELFEAKTWNHFFQVIKIYESLYSSDDSIV